MAKKEISYNEAIRQIEKIITEIENDEPDVDELVKKIKTAGELLRLCKHKLHSTEEEIEKIIHQIDLDISPEKD